MKESKKQLTECASKEGYAKTAFQVDGNCSMCKERIEEAATQVEGVEEASWDAEKDQLTLAYHKKQVKLMDVHNKIAGAGHDTKKVAATDEAYRALPMCCKYREE
ncbi:MAG: ATPase [Bacteroidales bacterium]|nr:ATPase [Bacteroidales bacterium]